MCPAVHSVLVITVLLISGKLLQMNMVALGLLHGVALLTALQLLIRLNRSSIELTLAVFLFTFVELTLYWLLFNSCKLLRIEFIGREQSTGERAKAIATDLNTDFICQVLHDLGTPITAMTLGLDEVTSRTDVQVPKDYELVLLDVKSACAHVKALRDRAVDFAVWLERQQMLRPAVEMVDVRKLVYSRLQSLLRGALRGQLADRRSFLTGFLAPCFLVQRSCATLPSGFSFLCPRLSRRQYLRTRDGTTHVFAPRRDFGDVCFLKCCGLCACWRLLLQAAGHPAQRDRQRVQVYQGGVGAAARFS